MIRTVFVSVLCVLASRARDRWKQSRLRLLGMLAVSFLILCQTNQLSLVLSMGLARAAVFLLVAVAIFFLVDQSSRLKEAMLACALQVLGIVLPATESSIVIERPSSPDELADAPILPSRFQRPPPLLTA